VLGVHSLSILQASGAAHCFPDIPDHYRMIRIDAASLGYFCFNAAQCPIGISIL
jgi:hypothetical protein